MSSSAPPPWVTAMQQQNNGTENGFYTQQGLAMFLCVVIFYLTSTVSVFLRLYAKRIKKLTMHIEDWVIIAAQIAIYCVGACDLCLVFFAGAGLHEQSASVDSVVNFLKIMVPAQIFYALSMMLTKASICLFLTRIFSIRKFRIAAYIVLGLNIGWGISMILAALLLCTPLEANWNFMIGQCGNHVAMFDSLGAIGLLIDILIFLLPLPFIWNLHVSRGDKVALSGIFGLGLFTMVISVLRIEALLKFGVGDITYSATSAQLWTYLEPAIAITVACGPLMRPLFGNAKTFRRFFTRTSKRMAYNSSQAVEVKDSAMSDTSSNNMKTVIVCSKEEM